MKRFALLAVVVTCALVGAGGSSAYRFEGGRWIAPVIPYYVEVPAYSWSVDTAAYAWNTSGATVQFVKVPRAQAKVLVGIRWYRTAGDAHVYRAGARLIRAEVGIRDGQDRYTMALVVAHEFGHVLGLDHEDRTCATMNTYLVGNHSQKCPAVAGGTWVCRLLRPDDVRGAVALYGGVVKPYRGPESCAR